ncbi:hypothetical protein DCAR_0831814 [Daucus carota subsp. sativus]|uniref:AB hydrolase-1 domain-containing protein n=1 Tax=Daucus carota subsp. sativus TaxID=79200 RepID=A0AAF0XS87_DAUCS|nr:hypothetical protein DCAR_0831814 [Daucus carota subsp. sativus]
MFRRTVVFLLIGLLAWAYQEMCPPPPKLCGSPGGPPVTGPRIKLRDGRHLAYMELGAPKDVAKYKIILVHGFGSNRFDTVVSKDLLEEMGATLVTFDRPGYGESDPDPKRTSKSSALDIQELADQLGLGAKFYVVGFSMGGQVAWGCLEHIPERLAGVALLAPVVNYWWPGFPANLSTEAYYEQRVEDQWALRVSHYTPWLTYWWNTQKLFPSSSVASGRPNFSRQDIEILTKLAVAGKPKDKGYSTQQGKFESEYRDMIIGFGKSELNPMDLKNPFAGKDGSVHLWQGDEDGLVPVTLQRYIAGKLPWIRYHELAGAGHVFPLDKHMGETIFKTLLLGENEPTADK